MIPGRFHRADAFRKFFEQHAHFQSGQPDTDTNMRTPLTKRQMAVVLAGKVDAVRVGEGGIIAIAADEPVKHFVARANLFAVIVEITRGGAAEIQGRGGPADDFIRGGIPDRARLQLRQQFGLMGKCLNPGGDGIAGCVVACSHHQAEQIAEFVFGHHSAVWAGLQNHVQDAVRIARSGLFAHQIFGINVKFGPGRRVERHHPKFIGGHFVQHMGGEIRVGVGHQRIALLHQPIEIFVRGADDAAQHAHGQLAGDVSGGIKGAFLQGIIKDLHTNLANDLFELRDHRAGKRAGNFDAHCHMIGTVGFLKGASGEVFFVGLVLHPDAARRGQQIGLAVQLQNIGLTRDGPKALAIGVVGPGHRIFAAQTGERVERGAVQKRIMAGQIGVAIVIGGPDRHGAISLLAGWSNSKYTKRVHKYVKWQIMHIAILMANTDESAFAQAHPRDGEKFSGLLRGVRPAWQFSVFSVKDGEFPPEGAVFDGWLITGSPASVNDPQDWTLRLLGLIRQIVAAGQPLFGACFGHQAIAVALGGVVGENPGGWVFGATDTVLEDEKIRLYAAHKEQVLALPMGAVVLGGNDECPIGSFAIGRGVLTTQYHPEMTPEFMAALVAEYFRKLPKEIAERAKASLAVPADTGAMAVRIVQFFEGG